MKALKLGGLALVTSLVFSFGQVDAFLTGENILGGREGGNITSVYLPDREAINWPSFFLESMQVSAIPQWAKDIVGA